MLKIVDVVGLNLPCLTLPEISLPTAVPSAQVGGGAPSHGGAAAFPDTEHPYHPGPDGGGNLRVDPEIHLPSPGMDVDIAYYYNANSPYNGPYGYGRTLNLNLTVQASGSPTLVTFTRGTGNVVTYQDDGAGHFFSATPNLLNTLVKDTSVTPNLWKETTPEGQLSVYPVNLTGALASVSYIQDAVGNRHTFSYLSGRLDTLEDAVGRRVSFTYNGAGVLEAIQDWAGRLTTFLYDTGSVAGKPALTTVIGPSGCQTGYGYQVAGTSPNQFPRLNRITDPNGYSTTYSYDGSGRISGRTIVGVGSSSYEYDGATSAMSEPDGGTTTYFRYGNGELRSIVDASGIATTFSRNDLGQEVGRYNPQGAFSSVVYDAKGIPLANIDALGHTTTFLPS